MSPYERYCNAMRERGLEPTMNEKELHKAWGIQDEEEYTPFLSRKSSSHKHIVPTLQNHIKPSTTQQIKINIVDKPKKIKREPTRIKLSKEQRRINKIATQKRWYRNVVKRDSGREVKDREYMSLDGLTDEQKKARRAEQKRACRKRQKEKINNEEDPRRSVC